jgi:PAS domain S-box-containing protein
MTDVVWTSDLQGTINYVSPSIKKLVGVLPDDYKKMSLAEKHPPETLQEFQSILEEEMELEKRADTDKNRSRVIEGKHLKADGSIFYIGMHVTFIRDESGNPIGLQGVTRDITDRIESEEKIKKNLVEKSLLLQELYHRTKNNMQVIASMMKLQSRQSNDTFLQQAFLDMINRIKSMALVHEKLYQSQNLSEINLKDYIQDLTKQISRSFLTGENMIKVVLDLQDIFIKIDSAIPLGLILSELISNVYKHAFPDNRKGSIAIKTFIENDIIHLTLADNGIGIKEKKDLKKVKSIGLETVFSLIEFQLKGNVRYTCEDGLKWHIEFKDDFYKARV